MRRNTQQRVLLFSLQPNQMMNGEHLKTLDVRSHLYALQPIDELTNR